MDAEEHICRPLTLLASQHGLRPTTTCGATTLTARQLHDRVAALSTALTQHLLLRPGDRVALLGLASDTFFTALLAAADAGGLACPLNWRWSHRELARALALLQPRLILVDAHLLPLLRRAMACELGAASQPLPAPTEPAAGRAQPAIVRQAATAAAPLVFVLDCPTHAGAGWRGVPPSGGAHSCGAGGTADAGCKGVTPSACSHCCAAGGTADGSGCCSAAAAASAPWAVGLAGTERGVASGPGCAACLIAQHLLACNSSGSSDGDGGGDSSSSSRSSDGSGSGGGAAMGTRSDVVHPGSSCRSGASGRSGDSGSSGGSGSARAGGLQPGGPSGSSASICGCARGEGTRLRLQLRRPPDGGALICFTSGTTSEPKGVVLSHDALNFQSRAKLSKVGYCEADVYLHTAPLFHIGGISSALAVLMAGSSHVFMPRYNAGLALELMERHSVTALIAVPAMLDDMVALCVEQRPQQQQPGQKARPDQQQPTQQQPTQQQPTQQQPTQQQPQQQQPQQQQPKQQQQPAEPPVVALAVHPQPSPLPPPPQPPPPPPSRLAPHALHPPPPAPALRRQYPDVTRLLVGAGSMSPALLGAVRGVFPCAAVTAAYGMTEAASSITFVYLGEGRSHVGASGAGSSGTSGAGYGGDSSCPPGVPALVMGGVTRGGLVCVGSPPPGIEVAVAAGAGPDAVAAGAGLSCCEAGVHLAGGSGLSTAGGGSGAVGAAGSSLGDSSRAAERGGSAGGGCSPGGLQQLVGEVLTRGPHLMLGYWRAAGETRKALGHGGWLHTGDLGILDSAGRLWLAGRVKDMVKSGGENVFAPEVEAVLVGLPGVAAVAVVGLPHARLGEEVAAVVVLRQGWVWQGLVVGFDADRDGNGAPGWLRAAASRGEPLQEEPSLECGQHGVLTADELRRLVRAAGLAGYKLPRRMACATHLPRNSSGKVVKAAVRAAFERCVVQVTETAHQVHGHKHHDRDADGTPHSRL